MHTDADIRNRLIPVCLPDRLTVEAVYYGSGTLFIRGLEEVAQPFPIERRIGIHG